MSLARAFAAAGRGETASDIVRKRQAVVFGERAWCFLLCVSFGCHRSAEFDPPKIAEFLHTALAKTRAAEAMIGGLNEDFTDECKNWDETVRFGSIYWARTPRSLWPLLRRAIGKALKWGAVIAAAKRLF